MPNSRRTPRRVNNNRKQQTGQRTKTIMKTALNGRAFTPSADPSTITEVPWNSLTLTYQANIPEDSIVDLTYTDIATALSNTIAGITTSFLFVRVLQTRMWSLNGTGITTLFHSLVNNSSINTLATLSDRPGRNQWARIGYIWPKDHQNQPISLGDNRGVILTTRSGSATELLLHINILWRSNAPPVPGRRLDFSTAVSNTDDSRRLSIACSDEDWPSADPQPLSQEDVLPGQEYEYDSRSKTENSWW